MALDVKVIIDQKKLAGEQGFGVPLLFCGMCAEAVPYTECADVDEVAALFGPDSRMAAAATLAFSQAARPAAVAVAGGVSSALVELPKLWDKNFRQLVVVSDDAQESTQREIAAYVEAKGDKVYFTSVQDLASLRGEGKDLTTFKRTFCVYYPGDAVCVEAAVAGLAAGMAVGSFTYKNLLVSGVDASDLTGSDIADAEALGCCCIVKKAGDVVTSSGAAANGEYLDVVDAMDYIVGEIEYRTQAALNGAAKVPYDNNGIALLESVCVNVLADAYAKGMVAVGADGLPDYQVDYRPRSETKPGDRAKRRYVEGSFTFALAGAVHEAVIHGEIEI